MRPDMPAFDFLSFHCCWKNQLRYCNSQGCFASCETIPLQQSSTKFWIRAAFTVVTRQVVRCVSYVCSSCRHIAQQGTSKRNSEMPPDVRYRRYCYVPLAGECIRPMFSVSCQMLAKLRSDFRWTRNRWDLDLQSCWKALIG